MSLSVTEIDDNEEELPHQINTTNTDETHHHHHQPPHGDRKSVYCAESTTTGSTTPEGEEEKEAEEKHDQEEHPPTEHLGISHDTTKTSCAHCDAVNIEVSPAKDDEENEEGNPGEDEEENPRPIWLSLIFVAVVFSFGVLEGIAFHRTGMTSPTAMLRQMTFDHWVVMKVFCGAIGMSMLCQGALACVFPERFSASRVWARKRFGWIRVIVGCGTLGVGMSLAGSGPTMLPPAIGANVTWAWAILVGGFVAIIAFAVWEKLMPALWEPPEVDPEEDKITLDQKLGLPYQVFGFVGGFVLILAGSLMEVFIPFRTDAAELGLTLSASSTVMWPPLTAGLIVGFNQIPLRLVASHGQGGSSAPTMVVGTATCGFLAEKFRAYGFKQLWQFIFVYLGSTAGSSLSAFALPQHEELCPQSAFHLWRCFVGGFLMFFGSNIAGGCACGHGITGVSELGLESIIGVCCIFGTAIPTGFIIKAIETYA